VPPRVTVEERVYQAAAAGLLELIGEVPAATAALLVVGHDPAIQGLAVSLAGDRRGGAAPPGAAGRMRAKFPTAAIAVLEFTGSWRGLGPGRARLAHFTTPRERAAGQPGSG
jgi:phosphohistidine phosphatase